MSLRAARLLVFSSAAAVLVLEILAGRILAPYLGVTIETFTGIIGTVLAGISVGAWLGGRAADRYDPKSLLGPLLIAGGILAMVAPPIVDGLGPSMRAAGPIEIVLLTVVAFFLPAAVLSAVSPVVVKLRLQSLDETGSVVGSLSAVGTAGAIFGTFVTGFVLIAALPTRPIVLGLGIALVVAGLVLSGRALTRGAVVVIVIAAAASGAALLTVDGPCDRETTYFCAYVTVDEQRPTGRVLWLDTLRHSYVDLEDPTYLGFRYARAMADVVAAHLPDGPVATLSIGGGGVTLPRYLSAVRPGSTNTVLEIDPSLVDLAKDDLGVVEDETLVIRVGDARNLVSSEAAAAYDIVIGDAFGGLSVPWHLTTREFVDDLRERMRPGGVYVLNLIDYGGLDFARAEAATMAEVFAHVAVIAPPSYLAKERGGNFVLAASDEPFDVAAISARIEARGGAEAAITGDDALRWIDGATPLRDDYAPADQLITRP
jgi:spermidine synthase